MIPETRRPASGPGPVLKLPPGLKYRAVAAGAVGFLASSAVGVELLCSSYVLFLPMPCSWAFWENTVAPLRSQSCDHGEDCW